MLKILMGELAPVRGIRHAHRYLVGRTEGLGGVVQLWGSWTVLWSSGCLSNGDGSSTPTHVPPYGTAAMNAVVVGSSTSSQSLFSFCRNLKIGYFSQHHVDQLDLNISAVELLARKFPGEFLLIPEVSFAVHGGALICPWSWAAGSVPSVLKGRCQHWGNSPHPAEFRSSAMRSGVADSLQIPGWCQILGADELFSCSQDEYWIPLSQLP